MSSRKSSHDLEVIFEGHKHSFGYHFYMGDKQTKQEI